MDRQRALWLMAALGLGLCGPARGVPLQSDDFRSGLAPFWKVHQVLRDTDAGQYCQASAAAIGGLLKMTSESDDIWNQQFQPFLLYQENITGAFDIRIQAISHNGQDSGSGAGGLMLLPNEPYPSVGADPSTYPSHPRPEPSRGHRPP